MGKAKKRVAKRAEDMSGYLVKRAQSLINLSLEEIVYKHGLGIPHYVVLILFAETPGLPNAELARKAFVTPQSMNEVLQQLEASGLVERQPSPSNARILNAQLTQMGEKKWRSVNDDVLEIGRASSPGSLTGRSARPEPIARDDHPEHDPDALGSSDGHAPVNQRAWCFTREE
jgi:DNA-binding MarR family transcriptional regulator